MNLRNLLSVLMTLASACSTSVIKPFQSVPGHFKIGTLEKDVGLVKNKEIIPGAIQRFLHLEKKNISTENNISVPSENIFDNPNYIQHLMASTFIKISNSLFASDSSLMGDIFKLDGSVFPFKHNKGFFTYLKNTRKRFDEKDCYLRPHEPNDEEIERKKADVDKRIMPPPSSSLDSNHGAEDHHKDYNSLECWKSGPKSVQCLHGDIKYTIALPQEGMSSDQIKNIVNSIYNRMELNHNFGHLSLIAKRSMKNKVKKRSMEIKNNKQVKKPISEFKDGIISKYNLEKLLKNSKGDNPEEDFLMSEADRKKYWNKWTSKRYARSRNNKETGDHVIDKRARLLLSRTGTRRTTTEKCSVNKGRTAKLTIPPFHRCVSVGLCPCVYHEVYPPRTTCPCVITTCICPPPGRCDCYKPQSTQWQRRTTCPSTTRCTKIIPKSTPCWTPAVTPKCTHMFDEVRVCFTTALDCCSTTQVGFVGEAPDMSINKKRRKLHVRLKKIPKRALRRKKNAKRSCSCKCGCPCSLIGKTKDGTQNDIYQKARSKCHHEIVKFSESETGSRLSQNGDSKCSCSCGCDCSRQYGDININNRNKTDRFTNYDHPYLNNSVESNKS